MKTEPEKFLVSYDQPWFIWLGDPRDEAEPILKQYGFDPVSQPSHHLFVTTQATWVLKTLDAIDYEKKWMKKASRKGAIRAIFLALDVNDFISCSHEDLKMLAGRYRQEISNIEKQLKSRVPVYGLWIHTETIPGLKEFWGKTLNLWSIGSSMNTHEEWQAKHLSAGLQSLRVVHNPKQKLDLLQSHVEWHQLLENWENFSKRLLASNPYQSAVLLEGYFLPSPDPIRPTSHDLVALCPPIQKNYDWTRLTLLMIIVLYLFSSIIEAYWSNKKRIEKIADSGRLSLLNLHDIVKQDHYPKLTFNWGFHRYNELHVLSAQALSETFMADILMPLMTRLKGDLNGYSISWNKKSDENRGRYYLTYKLYRILSDSKKRISPEVAHTLTDYWLDDQNNRLKDELPRNQWYPVLSILLENTDRSGMEAIEPALIATIQQQLQSSAASQNIYSSWRAEEELHGRWVTFDDLVRSSDSLFVSDMKLAGIYTRSAWNRFNTVKLAQLIARANDDRWLFNEPEESAYHRKIQTNQQREAIVDLYRQDYFIHWVQFIRHIRMKPSDNLKDSIKRVNRLVKHPWPISHILDLIRDHLRVVSKGVSSPHSLKPYFKNLSQVTQQMATGMAMQNHYKFSTSYAKQMIQNDPNNALVQSDHQITQWIQDHYSSLDLQRSIKRCLFSPLHDIGHQVLNEAREQIQTQWTQEVYAVYQQKIVAHFPFLRQGPDLPVDNFTEFYHPEHGKLAVFIRDHLRTIEGSWHGARLNIVPAARKHPGHRLFAKGQPSLQLNFEILIKPVAQIKEISFIFNNQTKRYQNQPEEWSEFSWLSDATPNDLVLRVLDNQNRELLKYHFHDTWALWHWLASADSTELTDDILWAKWKLKKSNRELIIGIRTKKYPSNQIATLLTQGLSIPEKILLSS